MSIDWSKIPIRSEDYQVAFDNGRTSLPRWEEGIDHHEKSERLMSFLKEHDFRDYDDHFDWKTGGDGDNGEALMYQMDAFFETQEDLISKLILKMEEYTKFLGEGLLAGALHGAACSSAEFKKGEQLRDEIDALKRSLI